MRTVSLVVLALALACSSSKDDEPPTVDGAPADAPVDKVDARGPGASCGGFAGSQCDAKDFCDYPDHSCGMADAAGECAPRPQLCPGQIDPVCGCDGMIYQNECAANAAGVAASLTAPCDAPPNQIRCGYRFCTAGQTCDEANDYACKTP